MDQFSQWKEWISLLDDALKPIAARPIDFTDLKDPNWLTRVKNAPSPLEEAGVKSETENLLAELVAGYPACDDQARQAVRKLFADHPSFSWAAALPYKPITDESFRAHLILFSMKDQEGDSRDALLALQSMCATAASAGVEIEPILKEVAELSSDVNRYGMGSTRSLLLHAIPASTV
jgi:hypothetical protein